MKTSSDSDTLAMFASIRPIHPLYISLKHCILIQWFDQSNHYVIGYQLRKTEVSIMVSPICARGSFETP